MIVGSDAKLCRVFAVLQIRPQDAVVHHVEERTDAVPALVVEPDLDGKKKVFSFLKHKGQKKPAGCKLMF